MFLGLENIISDISESLLVLLGVIALILIIAWFLRGFFSGKRYMMSRVLSNGRLKVREKVYIDDQFRLVVCAFEDKEYLILLGKNHSLVIDGYIPQKLEEQLEEQK